MFIKFLTPFAIESWAHPGLTTDPSAIETRTDRLEGLAGVVDPQSPVVVRIQREGSPLSSQPRPMTVCGAAVTKKPLQRSPGKPDDAPLSNFGFSTASTSVMPTKSKEDAGEQVNEDRINSDKRREEEQGTDDLTPPVTRQFTQIPPPPVTPATIRLPSPAVPTRVASSKRKFIDEQDTRCNSTDAPSRAPELPRLKRRKLSMALIPPMKDWKRSRPWTAMGWRRQASQRQSSSLVAVVWQLGLRRDRLAGTWRTRECPRRERTEEWGTEGRGEGGEPSDTQASSEVRYAIRRDPSF